MALHNAAQILALPQFDLFGVPPVQLMVKEDIQTKHSSFTALNNATTPIQFVTSTVPDEYVIFNKSELTVRMRIDLKKGTTKSESMTAEDWKRICPINYLLNTMWKSISLEIGTFPVTATTLNYPYIAYMDALLNLPDDVKSTHLITAMWHKDRPQQMDNIHGIRSANIWPIDNDMKHSCIIELIGYLHLDLSAQQRAMIGGMNYRLTLYPHDPKFYLMHDDDLHPTVNFLKVELDLHRAKVTDELLLAHNRMLNKYTAKYPITRKECRNFIVQKGLIDYNENTVIKSDRLPRKAFVAMVNNEAFNGSNRLNPFNFKNYDIQNIRIRLNNKDYPSQGYECDFTSRLINHPYRCLYEALGQIEAPRALLTRLDFMEGFSIFGFNFNPDMADGVNKNNYISPIKHGDMSLHIRFRTPLPETATVIVFLEYDNLIEIPESRLPFKDFA